MQEEHQVPTKATTKTTTAAVDESDVAAIAAERRAAYDKINGEARAFDRWNESRSTAGQIRGSWRSGDAETYSAFDLAVAQVEDVRAEDLLVGLRRRLNRAEDRLITEHPLLAQAAAECVADALGLHCEARSIEPRSSYVYQRGDEPRVVVVQEGLHRAGSQGSYSGTLVVHVIRSEHHAVMTPERIERALADQGWAIDSVGGLPRETVEGGVMDTIDVRVTAGFARLPIIEPAPDLEAVAWFVGNRIARDRQALSDGPITAKPVGTASIVQDTTEDGQRVIIAEVEAEFVGPAADLDRLAWGLGHLPDAPCAIGRIRDAELIHAGPLYSQNGAAIGSAAKVRVTAHSASVQDA